MFSSHAEDNIVQYEPCSTNDPEGIPMSYEDFETHELYHRKLSFECLQEIFSKSQPSVEFEEVNQNRLFEMNHPNVTFTNMEYGKSELTKKNQTTKHLFKKRFLLQSFERRMTKANDNTSLFCGATENKSNVSVSLDNSNNTKVKDSSSQKAISSKKSINPESDDISPIREAINAINEKRNLKINSD